MVQDAIGNRFVTVTLLQNTGQPWRTSPSARKVRVGNPDVDAVLVRPSAQGATAVHCAHVWLPSVRRTRAKDVAIGFAQSATLTRHRHRHRARPVALEALAARAHVTPQHRRACASSDELVKRIACACRTFLWPHRQFKFRKFYSSCAQAGVRESERCHIRANAGKTGADLCNRPHRRTACSGRQTKILNASAAPAQRKLFRFSRRIRADESRNSEIES